MQHFGYPVPVDEEEGFEAFAVICKVLKGKTTQSAYLRNGIKSRKVTGFEGHNLKVEQIFKLREIGSDDDLLRMAQLMPSVVKPRNFRKAAKQKLSAQLALSKIPDPVYQALQEAYVFNLSLEVAQVYNLCQLVDRSIDDDLTVHRFKTQVLYLETRSKRYELARLQNNAFRLAEVAQPSLKDENFFSQVD